MDSEERNTPADMVAQAVMDKMEERERTNALADLVVARVLEMQKQKASLQAKSSPDGLLPIRKSSMPEITPLSEADALETAHLKFESEKMTRRAALRKLGITSSMAFFSLFAVDDLARVAIKRMRQNEATRDIAETVAREFKDSGIAFATTPVTTPCLVSEIKPGCAGGDIGTNCACCQTAAATQEACVQQACLRCYPNGLSLWPWDFAETQKYNQCLTDGDTKVKLGYEFACPAKN